MVLTGRLVANANLLSDVHLQSGCEVLDAQIRAEELLATVVAVPMQLHEIEVSPPPSFDVLHIVVTQTSGRIEPLHIASPALTPSEAWTRCQFCPW